MGEVEEEDVIEEEVVDEVLDEEYVEFKDEVEDVE
jgi:hypothetical protein